MQINLNTEDLNQAVQDYVQKSFTIAQGSTVTVEFIAGRGDKGPRASVEITRPGQTPVAATEEAKPSDEPTTAASGDPLFS